jgi:8-oxo-dGTP diphosphatase
MFWTKKEPDEVDDTLTFRAAGCFCVVDGNILLMQRHPKKSYGLHWAIPTGKIESGESPRACMVRELREEINADARPYDLQLIGDFIVSTNTIKFEYVTFVLHFDRLPELSPNAVEVHRLEWIPIDKIRKRKVVPYFYNTVNALIEWETNRAAQASLLPEMESTRVDRIRLRKYRSQRISRPDRATEQERELHSSAGLPSIW